MSIFNKILGIIFVIAVMSGGAFATEQQTAQVSASAVELTAQKDNRRKVVVISDRIYQANQKYYIYPEVTEMIAQDVINELNKQGFLYSPTLTGVRDRLKKNDVCQHANKLLNDYHYTYNIDFDALSKVALKLGADDILLITGGLDTTSDFMKPTWYSFLNIPGENSIKSEFRLSAHFVLIDVKNQVVTWEKNYTKHLTATEFALAGGNPSPEYRQLTKMKKSSSSIAKDAAYRVESVLTPMLALQKTPPTMHEKLKFNINKKYDEHIQNINHKKELKKQQEKAIKAVKAVEPINAVDVVDAVVEPVPEVVKAIEVEEKTVEQAVTLPKVAEPVTQTVPKVVSVEEKAVVPSTENIKETVNATPEIKFNSDELRPVYKLEESGEKYIQISPLNIIIPKM